MSESGNLDIYAIIFGPTNTPIEALDFFEISSGSNTREVMLAVFRSELGSELQLRDPSADLISHFRNTLSQMVAFAEKTDAGLPDEYFVELADGSEVTYIEIPPSRRFVLSFENESWRTQEPVRVSVN